MSIDIHLKGKPISTQHAYGLKRIGKFISMYMKPDAKKLKQDYILQIKRQYTGEIITKEIEIIICLIFPDRIRRDWDNWHKISMDAMNGLVWKDDSQIMKSTVHKIIKKGETGIVIRVNDYDDSILKT